jgi:predicted TIM-barrel fold metal-dependent hydrolase
VTQSTSAEVRRRLSHPVIDADGHMREFLPAALPYLRDALGSTLFESWRSGGTALNAATKLASGMDQRRLTRKPQSAFWATLSGDGVDRATASSPALLYDRLEELGMDFVVLYATEAMGVAGTPDDDLRIGLCRSFNEFFAAISEPYRDRMAVAGLVPMHTPAEAVAELDHCHQLGLRVACIPHGVVRPIAEPATAPQSPYLWPGQSHWTDTFGLDSEYDYDPVWEAFRRHGYAVTSHGGMAIPVNVYTSTTSFTYNHLGSFAQMMYPLCKSLYLGGVTRRFPDLPFAFLECGVSWACSLLVDLVEHWEKRNVEALQATRPDLLDTAEVERLLRAHPGRLLDRLEGNLSDLVRDLARPDAVPDEVDEWIHLGITTETDIRDLFVPNFYFGCEADDRTAAFAFSPANAFHARLNAVFSSDIGHWDVRHMNRVVSEAWGLVDDGVFSEEDFRDFVFANPARLYLSANPDFFAGTAVEADVASLTTGSPRVAATR